MKYSNLVVPAIEINWSWQTHLPTVPNFSSFVSNENWTKCNSLINKKKVSSVAMSSSCKLQMQKRKKNISYRKFMSLKCSFISKWDHKNVQSFAIAQFSRYDSIPWYVCHEFIFQTGSQLIFWKCVTIS